jgi:hypothetical protein
MQASPNSHTGRTLVLRLMVSLLAIYLGHLASAQVVVTGPSNAPFKLDDAVLVAGTSVVGTDNNPWAYVVWNSPGRSALEGKAFSIYLQATPNGSFTKQATVSPTADPAALGLLLSRAASIHENISDLDNELKLLLRRKTWGGNVNANGIALNTSSFDNKSTATKLSGIMDRVMRSADASTAFKMSVFEHPSLRMATGRGWAGRLPAGAGPMTIEVREHVNGADGGVIGRVTLTPGQGIALEAPGNVFQVPDLKPTGNLTIKLRWAVPAALRRQQQHIIGFRVYRIERADWDSAGLPMNPSSAQLQDFATAHNESIGRVNDAPVPIHKLFSNHTVNNFGISPTFNAYPPEPSDSEIPDATTFFIADDNDAGTAYTDAPNSLVRPHYHEGTQFYYAVRAVDLIGREGPPSPLGLGKVPLTIPPDVPGGLVVRETGSGDGRNLKLTWKANGTPQNVTGRTAQRYAIYRGDLPNGFTTSLQQHDDPNQFKLMTPLGYVNQTDADANGLLTFTDTTVSPLNTSEDRSVWYAVTALHQTPIDPVGASPHNLVHSAPSPPAFGILRDHHGPDAPVGGVFLNTTKLASVFDNATTSPRTGSPPTDGIVHFRVTCHRLNRAPVLARFVFASGHPGNFYGLPNGTVGNNILNISPILAFPPGSDDVSYEADFFTSQTVGLSAYCVTGSSDGCISTIAASSPQAFTASTSTFTVLNFSSGRFSARDFASDSTSKVANTATDANASAFTVIAPDFVRATLPDTSLNGQTLLAQVRFFPNPWITIDSAPAQGNHVFFRNKGRTIGDVFSLSYRILKLPPGGDCPAVHIARPVGAEDIVPIEVYTNIPLTTREWRIYRSVDGGDKTLVKSGIVNLTGASVDAVIIADTALPPDGARVAYYAQCFDQNQNPSPLTFLREVILQANPAQPVLSQPLSLPGNQMSLKWVCPATGVKRFVIYALPLNYGDAEPTATAGITKVILSTPPNGILLPAQYKLPGNDKLQTVTMTSEFDLPPLNASTPGPTFSAVLNITPNVPYVVWIRAIGGDAVEAVDSTAQLYTYTTPAADPPPESIVPWPARPLPPVINVEGVYAFNMSEAINGTGYEPTMSTIPSATAAALYPVGVTIGLLPFAPAAITHAESDPLCTTHPIVFSPQSLELVNGHLEAQTKILSKGSDPNAYLWGDLMPCVLYRQTVLGTNAGATIQVSPYRDQIAQQTVTQTYQGATQDITTVRDPFIKTLTYTTNGFTTSAFTLVDTHSVEEGATYHYYLVRYDTSGEIKHVIDCGVVTIPEAN